METQQTNECLDSEKWKVKKEGFSHRRSREEENGNIVDTLFITHYDLCEKSYDNIKKLFVMFSVTQAVVIMTA